MGFPAATLNKRIKKKAAGDQFILMKGASVAEWLRSLTSNHLPLTAVGSNPDRDFEFFHVRKLSS
jgi:hypothetical protein